MLSIHLEAQIPQHLAGLRLDQALIRLFPQYSRTQYQHWIRQGLVSLDGQKNRPKDSVQTGQRVTITANLVSKTQDKPQNIALKIIYEDENLLIVDKPSGLIVHPGAGHSDSTLVNGLLHYDPLLEKLPRAGLIHRLDKETSGLLLVARQLETYTALVNAMKLRQIHREYQCIVQGLLISGRSIEAPIGRHPRQRTQMAVMKTGKMAVTHYRIIEKFQAHTHLRVQLETGRTHQIRVHLSHIGNPILGDPLYLKQLRFPPGLCPSLKERIKHFPRQALHATKLELLHPNNGKLLTLKSPFPQDIQELLTHLKNSCST